MQLTGFASMDLYVPTAKRFPSTCADELQEAGIVDQRLNASDESLGCHVVVRVCNTSFILGRDLTQFPVAVTQAWWNRHRVSAQHAFQLQRIDRGLALEVVVGHHKGLLRLAGDGIDAAFPLFQLGLCVEIVVAIVARVGVEPLLIVAAMEAYISEV